ncbi:MAG TPA: hypothetical protein PLQ20_01955 [Candidatus Paceibacterota bacterium]|nr:hypothetical protein [Candidatus Paceibacterota bacterium]
MNQRETLVKFKVWKTITLGLHTTTEEYRQNLVKNHCIFSMIAYEILSKCDFSKTKQEINLFKATVGELGFESPTTYQEVCDKLTDLGYKICSAEVGPSLRTEYKEQAEGDIALICMNAVICYHNAPFIFCLGLKEGKNILGDYRAWPDDELHPEREIIFSN